MTIFQECVSANCVPSTKSFHIDTFADFKNTLIIALNSIIDQNTHLTASIWKATGTANGVKVQSATTSEDFDLAVPDHVWIKHTSSPKWTLFLRCLAQLALTSLADFVMNSQLSAAGSYKQDCHSDLEFVEACFSNSFFQTHPLSVKGKKYMLSQLRKLVNNHAGTAKILFKDDDLVIASDLPDVTIKLARIRSEEDVIILTSNIFSAILSYSNESTSNIGKTLVSELEQLMNAYFTFYDPPLK